MNAFVQKIIGEGASGEVGTVGFTAPPPPPPPSAPRTPVQSVTGAPAHAAEEKREVIIGHEILSALAQISPITKRDLAVQRIEQLARELIQMHGV